MSRVRTVHSNENGEQVTRRVGVLEDATGEEYRYPFLVTDDGLDYNGDGEPSERALEVLDEAIHD
ncbi:hypothetical protein [Halopiger aswanensis]|uniref:Uncharacterized protein n=1 Tax=Halopiger aswanensis TaxID=148449 RepID=A0A419VU50_9EURY|nr:hypothetical protein [Halopiger aswanensis]RKD85005.1 hypothetical protein ATJ93_4774 [Halopiger aswanensis]